MKQPTSPRTLAATVTVVSLVAFLLLAFAARLPQPLAWDAALQSGIRNSQTPLLTTFLTGLTWFGNTYVQVTTDVVLIMASLVLRQFRYATSFALIGLMELGNQVIQEVIGRTRPDSLVQSASDSFPSGHPLHIVLLGGFLVAMLLPRIAGSGRKLAIVIVFLVIVVLMGFSRVYLGFHWPTDALGGFLLAVPALQFVLFVHQRLPQRKHALR
ncbi:MAG: phosphatase PAP2 family protein [Dehalococcoidia bacterium]|nr:phosphatase PAP2 family protein [Dehalococcoidia bacterium]